MATLEDSHFFPLSQPGQCWPRNSFSTPRKDARGVRFRYLFREVLKVLNQMRHKAAQTHFLPCIFFFRGAFLFSTRPTPDLAPEESKKEKSMLHSLIFYAPSPPSPKERVGRMKGGRSLKEKFIYEKLKNGSIKPVFLPSATLLSRKNNNPLLLPYSLGKAFHRCYSINFPEPSGAKHAKRLVLTAS